jgi:peroxiredoxin Q/BCP
MMTIALAVLAMLQDKGAPAPDFSAPNQDGKVIRFADFKGKKNILLAFYPKDNTPG